MLSRRDLLSIIPAGAATCMGRSSLALCAQKSTDQTASPATSTGPSASADMTWERAFRFRYKGYIHLMKRLSSLIGNDKFPALLSESSSEAASEAAMKVEPEPGRDMENFIRYFLNELMPAPIYRSARKWDIVEKSLDGPRISLFAMPLGQYVSRRGCWRDRVRDRVLRRLRIH